MATMIIFFWIGFGVFAVFLFLALGYAPPGTNEDQAAGYLLLHENLDEMRKRRIMSDYRRAMRKYREE